MGSKKNSSSVRFLIWALVAAATVVVPNYLAPKPNEESWLFFDGVCNLCDGFVNFVADHDPERKIKFGAIQRHQELMTKHGAGQYAEGGDEYLTTVVLIQGGHVHVRSAAALRTLAALEQPWRALSVLYLIPAPIRDLGYRLVGKYRYAMFGHTDECRVPSGSFKSRFLEYDPAQDGDPDGQENIFQQKI